jgi:hypothetical protein
MNTLLGRQIVSVTEEINMEVPHNRITAAIIRPKELKPRSQRHLHVFTEALFTVTKTWNQPQCPLLKND